MFWMNNCIKGVGKLAKNPNNDENHCALFLYHCRRNIIQFDPYVFNDNKLNHCYPKQPHQHVCRNFPFQVLNISCQLDVLIPWFTIECCN